MSEFISFSALLNGELVRMTVAIKDIDIVDRTNEVSYDVEKNVMDLKSIEIEDVY